MFQLGAGTKKEEKKHILSSVKLGGFSAVRCFSCCHKKLSLFTMKNSCLPQALQKPVRNRESVTLASSSAKEICFSSEEDTAKVGSCSLFKGNPAALFVITGTRAKWIGSYRWMFWQRHTVGIPEAPHAAFRVFRPSGSDGGKEIS